VEKKVGLVVIDYIQLISNGGEKRVDDVGKTTLALKSFTGQMGVPILGASQLSRNIEHRAPGSDPMLADLRESGSIEQDATIVAFLRTPWVNPTREQKMSFPENVDERGMVLDRLKVIPIRFHFEKNRNGPTGISDTVRWRKHTGEFDTLTNEELRR
jgi:replicative DNA helicase